MEQVLIDTVSRLDAIKQLRNEYPPMPLFKDLRQEWAIKTEGYRKAEEVIMRLPSADRSQGWIPCGERMPEYLKTVLISTFWGVKTGFLDSTEAYGDFWEIIEDDATTALHNVYAWMPLPKPWKGASR